MNFLVTCFVRGTWQEQGGGRKVFANRQKNSAETASSSRVAAANRLTISSLCDFGGFANLLWG